MGADADERGRKAIFMFFVLFVANQISCGEANLKNDIAVGFVFPLKNGPPYGVAKVAESGL